MNRHRAIVRPAVDSPIGNAGLALGVIGANRYTAAPDPFCWTILEPGMIRRLSITCAVLMLLLTYGCGNKGPLYLPQDDQPTPSQQNEQPAE